MKRHLIPMLSFAVSASFCMGAAVLPDSQQSAPSAAAPAQPPSEPEMPPMPPAPGKHHEWLQQLIGEWTVESEMIPPGMDPITSTATDSVRSIGGRWIVAELKGEIPGFGPIHAVMTLGYDSEKNKYQGTWVDSIQDHLWVYDATLDSDGKVLTLEADGPGMTGEGTTRYRDVIEIKSPDHRTLTSSALGPDGNWVQFGVSNYRRVKGGAGGPAALPGDTVLNLAGKPVELGCASCIYKMPGVKDCLLAAKVDGRIFMVAGTHNLDPHDFCVKGKPATVTGTIEGDSLIITTVTMK